MTSDKFRKAFPEIAALTDHLKPHMDEMKKVFQPEIELSMAWSNFYAECEPMIKTMDAIVSAQRRKYYSEQERLLINHLANTGGQKPLRVPYGPWGGQLEYRFERQFDNWAAWLGGLVDGTTVPSYGFYELTDDEWDRLQAYTDNWDYIEPVPWMTGPILGGLVDE